MATRSPSPLQAYRATARLPEYVCASWFAQFQYIPAVPPDLGKCGIELMLPAKS